MYFPDEFSRHDHPHLDRFSFWKPDPVPPRNQQIMPVKLHTLGTLESVKAQLAEVPRLHELPASPFSENEDGTVTMKWEIEEGVILQVRIEQGPPAPGEVLTINACSATSRKAFYRLYVQIYEQMGVTLLDERTHNFFTPREFRVNLHN